MKKYMTLEELYEFLNQQFELSMVELTDYMESLHIEPKTKIMNIPRYEQEDSQKIYDHFLKIKTKKSIEEVKPVEHKIKENPFEHTIENREYTIPEMAAIAEENKSKFYRFVGQNKIKPTQIKNNTKYFSHDDTLKIISHFIQNEPTEQTAMNRGSTDELGSELSEPNRELASELKDGLNERDHDEIERESRERTAMNRGSTDELGSELSEPNRELASELKDELTERDHDEIERESRERIAMNRGLTSELGSELSEPNRELISELQETGEETVNQKKHSFSQEAIEKKELEITYLKRENDLLRGELEQKNRQLAELTQRLEQAQYLHSKTQTISEKQQPFFKMPEIIEADKIETTEPKEPSKKRFLGFFNEK